MSTEDLDEMGDGVQFRIAGDDNCLRSQSSADGEGIGVGDGKLRLHLGCFKDVRESIGHGLDREGLQAMQELLHPAAPSGGLR